MILHTDLDHMSLKMRRDIDCILAILFEEFEARTCLPAKVVFKRGKSLRLRSNCSAPSILRQHSKMLQFMRFLPKHIHIAYARFALQVEAWRWKRRIHKLRRELGSLRVIEEESFRASIGYLVTSWAAVEASLDQCNQILLFISNGSKSLEIPISLKSKLDLFRKSHNLPALASLKHGSEHIRRRVTELKSARHAIVHGCGWKRTTNFVHTATVRTNGPGLIKTRIISFSDLELQTLIEDIYKLTLDILDHCRNLSDIADIFQSGGHPQCNDRIV